MPTRRPKGSRNPDAPISIGQAIAIVRTELYSDDEGPGLSQPALYRKCTLIEEKMPLPAKGRRRFKPSDWDAPKKKIGKIEADTDQRLYELTIIAKAFGLQEDFFKWPFSSEHELRAAYTARKRQPPVQLLPAPVEQAGRSPPPAPPSQPPRASAGFLRLSSSEILPRSRREKAAEFSRLLREAGLPKSLLVLLQGRTGVGKTFFVSHWFHSYGQEIFKGDALLIDCSTASFDQILPKVEEYFVSAHGGAISVSEALAANHDNLIVLDGLKLEQFSEGPHTGPLIAGVTPGRRPQLRDLAELVAPFLNSTRNTVIILCLENNSKEVADTVFVRPLERHVQVKQWQVDPLDDDEGAEFLADLGVSSLDVGSRRRISSRLHGLPIALDAAAKELMRLVGAEREAYIDGLPSASASVGNDFERFFRNYLSRLDADGGALADPHPHALLRLLALMPGPIPETHLDEILSKKRVTRLKNLSSEAVMTNEFPFTAVVSRTINVHGMVRSILRAEIDEFIQKDKFDNSNTSREELEWIHWQAARFHWNTIRKGNEPNSTLVTAIESFVYHMMAQTRLIPPESARRRKRPTGGADDIALEGFEQRSGRLSNGQLWSIAYDKAVRPFLISDNRHLATRIHGQYEAKARILQLLTDAVQTDAVREGVIVAPLTLAELHKETAVCWMHAGRLKSAGDSATEAAARIMSVRSGKTNETPEMWKLRCDIESASAAIELRLDRRIGDIEDRLRPFRLKALQIAERVLAGSPFEGEGRAPPEQRGALRVLGRVADVALYSGRTAEAIEYFELADALQNKIRGRPIDGEAARKFVVALVRTREEQPGRMGRARELVERNIEYCNNIFPSTSARASNDVIPFLVLRAALQRVAGDLSQASSTLDLVRRHEFVRKGECTFVAIAELELEEIRLEIARGAVDAGSLDRALFGKRRLEEAHHAMLSLEANLLAAECCTGELRHLLLAEATTSVATREAHLREADVRKILDRGSAVATFGL
jgi:hypothetical protein